MEDRGVKQQANYLLPADLVEDVWQQARRERRWPANVVEDACREYLSRKREPSRRKPASVAD